MKDGTPAPQRKHAAAAAFQFLSRFPVKMQIDFVPSLLRESVVFYPLVGAAIGLCVWLMGALSGAVLPAFPAAVLTLTLWVWLTGGLHLDGWMDTADGLLSYRTRERMLEIMKDSRVGAMGVIACVLLLMMKAALIADFIARGHWMYGALLILPMIWSRWFMVYAMSAWPNARGDDGLAVLFKGLGERKEVQRSRRLSRGADPDRRGSYVCRGVAFEAGYGDCRCDGEWAGNTAMVAIPGDGGYCTACGVLLYRPIRGCPDQ